MSVAVTAQYAGRCPFCGDDIEAGEEIATCEGEWGHLECVDEWQDEE